MNAPPIHRFEAAGLGTAPFTVEGMRVMKYQACQGAPIQPGSSCDYCGQGIMLVFAIRGADGRRFKVGCDCVLKTGDAGIINTTKRLQTAHRRELAVARAERARESKRRTRADAARQRRQQTRTDACAFARKHGLTFTALRVALRGPKRAIAKDMLGKLVAFGTLSDAQLRFLKSLCVRLTPAPSGRVTFSGVIQSVQARDAGYRRVQYKMTVTADAGFRVWCTAPQALWAQGRPPGAAGAGLGWLSGRRITITATLEPSRDDPGFAFGKRPTLKLEAEPAAAAAG
jgi:hypothetical protein